MAQLAGVQVRARLSSPWVGRELAGKTHLADLRQRHGDDVELVLAGAGNQCFLRWAEAQTEDVLLVGLTRVIALKVYGDLPKMGDCD